MKKFVKNILLFFCPVLLGGLLMSPFYFVALSSGEFKDITVNIELQRENPDIIVGLAYNEQTPYYKLENANYDEAEVVALGTSRVMQIKDMYFDSNFYNCGGAVNYNYNEYVNFLKNMSYTPEVIILGVDTWVFNDAWNNAYSDYENFTPVTKINRNEAKMLASIIKGRLAGSWKFSDLNNYSNNIGFNGRIKDNGFMHDGSYYYGNIYRYPEKQTDYQFVDTLERISTGTRRFEWGEHIDTQTIAQLENLLEYCEENDIYVIGFLPPFAPTVYNEMIQSGNYQYVEEIVPACNELFERYGYELYDYSNGQVLQVDDSYFVDGFHGSEVVYGYIIRDMLEKDSVLGKYVNEEKLSYLLENAHDGFTFYKPDGI